MPASKHRKHNHGASRHRKIKARLNRGTMANIHSAIDRAQLDAVAKEGAHLPDRERGMYPKYQVARVDGSSSPGGKHATCPKFVLDLEHDPHAIPALFSYATSARADGYELLAGELYGMIQPYIQQLEDHAKDTMALEMASLPMYAEMTDTQLHEAVVGHVWGDMLPGEHNTMLLHELLERFEKATAPKPKRTRKKKDADSPETIKEAA